MPTRNLQILCIAVVICLGCYFQAQRLRLAGELGTAMQLISRVYVEKVDERELFESAMNGMLADLDPYSAYIPPKQYQPFQDFLKQEFEGLGVNLDGPPNVERLTVVTPLAGTPAYKAGIEPGDVIMAINDQSTEGMTTSDASELLRGPEGTSVRLELKREGTPDPIKLEIVRAAVDVQSVVGERRKEDGSWDYFLPNQSNIAYVRIESFGEKTSQELSTALGEIKGKAKALVLDLRENAGGLLPSAVEISDMFLNEGEIVSIRGRANDDRMSYDATDGTEFAKELPIVVMVNEGSASASEILAACLKDHGRATIAGERSFGKGTIQQVFVMDGGKSGLKLTTAKYFPPSGDNIHRSPKMTDKDQWGILPAPGLDVKLDDDQKRKLFQRWRRKEDPRQNRSGETEDTLEDDPQLKKALEFLAPKVTKPAA